MVVLSRLKLPSQILQKVQSFLKRATDDSVELSEELIEQFGEDCKDAIRKQFTTKRESKFRTRMSNAGRPLCQLQMEKKGIKGEGQPYSNKMRNSFGDLIEALSVLILKASDVNVNSTQKGVTYDVDNTKIDGTYDIDSVINKRVVITKWRDLEIKTRNSSRDSLKFYRKRIPCKCLKKMHLEARKATPKMGEGTCFVMCL